MCGIFGVSSKHSLSDIDKAFLKLCAIAGAVRGHHSTGLMMTLGPNDHVRYIKRAVNGTEFVTKLYDPTVNIRTGVKAVTGHNRWATVGNISDDTAHPFIEGNIIGVHNGTLDKGWESELQVSKDCDVDSRGLYRCMSARGVEWTIENLHGAAALVWTELDSKRTFVYRNTSRSLWWVESNLGKIYYASEKGMLVWLLEKSKISMKGEPKKFKDEHLYEITDGNVKEVKAMVTPYSKQRAIDEANAEKNKSKGGNSQKKRKFRGHHRTTPTGGTQKGVHFRGSGVGDWHLKRGIVGEWAELGFDIPTCACCDGAITDATYLETCAAPQDKIHMACLDTYRAEVSVNASFNLFKRDPTLSPFYLTETKSASK